MMVNVWRLMNVFFLLVLWITQDGSPESFVLIVSLTILACMQWRFKMPTWTVLIDLMLCAIFIPIWSGSVFGLILPVYEIMAHRKYGFLIPVLIIIAAYQEGSLLLFWLLFQAGILGVFTVQWHKQREQYITEADRQRFARYSLENMRDELLKANRKTAQLTEVSERNRIARDLHDHVGHDLTGANLALEAYDQLEGADAEEMLYEVKVRIARSTSMLRDTVHDMTPVTRMGADVLEHITQEFMHAPVSFQKAGDTNDVPIHYWSLLEPCLKEALTNVARHSDATKVDVQLDVTDTIVRLSIQDNGKSPGELSEGRGIRNLKLRARAHGGSLSVDSSSGYLVVCVLPLEEEDS